MVLAIQRKGTCRDPGLNRGPSDLQSDALPTELSRLYVGAPAASLSTCNYSDLCTYDFCAIYFALRARCLGDAITSPNKNMSGGPSII